MYFKPETQTAYKTHSEIRAAHPDVSFPAAITDVSLSAHGIYPLTEGHDFGAVAQAALLDSLVLPVPTTLTIRQAKLVLLAAGLLDDVDAAVAGADRATQIEWEFSTEVRRDWPTLVAMATALGMSDSQLDDLFVAGAQL